MSATGFAFTKTRDEQADPPKPLSRLTVTMPASAVGSRNFESMIRSLGTAVASALETGRVAQPAMASAKAITKRRVSMVLCTIQNNFHSINIGGTSVYDKMAE
jgi:hypothetical protein